MSTARLFRHLPSMPRTPQMQMVGLIVSVMLVCWPIIEAVARPRTWTGSRGGTALRGSSSPLFSFGAIADIQYTDQPDSMNFQRTRMRRYASSLDIYRAASAAWKKSGVDFTVVLGDMIDAKSRVAGRQNNELQDLLEIAALHGRPSFHAFGNHCHWCFSRPVLRSLVRSSVQQFLGECSTRAADAPMVSGRLNHSWRPAPGWRCLSIDAYDVSLVGPSSQETHLVARQTVAKNNPNDLSDPHGWFKGLPLEKHRFVPYNGAVSDSQLAWLRDTLKDCERVGDRAILFCHQPVFSPGRPKSLLWNAEDVLHVLHSTDAATMWMAGHDHEGQYAVDAHGIAHIVLPAPIEREPGQQAFAQVDVCGDHLRLQWRGPHPASSYHTWPSTIPVRQRRGGLSE